MNTKSQKRAWDTKHWLADTTRTTKFLNLKPKTTLAEGFMRTYDWFVKNINIYAKEPKWSF